MKSLLAIALLLFGLSLIAEPLNIGDSAPELEITSWVKNGPVKLSDGKDKNVYVIEFWATWCPPCRASIPHLSKLQEKYKDKGLVVVGISNEDTASVERFVKTQKDMEYHVGVDTSKDKTYSKYMDGVDGIPHAFIVGKDGKIVWSGHPMKTDEVIVKILDGTFSAEVFMKEAGKEKEISRVNQKITELLKASEGRISAELIAFAREAAMSAPDNDYLLDISCSGSKMEENIAFLDKLIGKHPDNHKPYVMKLERLYWAWEDDDEGLSRPERVALFVGQFIRKFDDNPEALNSIVRKIQDEILFREWPLEEMLDAAEKCVKKTPSEDNEANAAHRETLGRCYYAIGLLDKAIAEQEKAVESAKGMEEEQEFISTLEFYRRALSLGKEKR